jgi:PAS domain S-box-containing protein
VNVDISERKMAVEELRSSEERMELALSGAGLGTWDWDLITNGVVYNERWATMLGYTLEEIEPNPESWNRLLHPEDMPATMESINKHFGGYADSFKVEFRMRHKDGSWVWIYAIGKVVLRDEEGKPLRACGTHLDVTERVLAKEQEDRFGHMLAHTLNEIYSFDATTFKFMNVNKGAQENLGYSMKELHQMQPSDIELEYSEQEFASMVEPLLSGQRSKLEYSTAHLRKDGTTYPVVVNLQLMGKENPTFVAIVADCTEREQAEDARSALERQVQHAQKLESLGVLAGGIAHDFNNILMAILGNADLALDELSTMSPARSKIEAIQNASKRAAALAKQMLAYSGKGRFVVESIDAGELLEEMVHLLEVSISKKAVLKYNFADNLPSFNADVTQVRQVIMNLITNASEAIGDRSGVIALSTGAMNCDRAYLDGIDEALRVGRKQPLPEGVYTYFEVADTGCGMDDKTLAKIFDPFFTTKFTGRGLGLSAVLGIVRGHGGVLKIYSESNRGTTFKVLFPANNLPEEYVSQHKPAEVDMDWKGTGTILIADDEEAICAVGKQMVERFGFKAITACDGREALELFVENQDEITCVLLDLTMPHMDGEEAFRELRRICPSVAVLLCSGYNEQDATQRFAGKGLAGFVQKPYTLATLQQKLMSIMPNAKA